MNKLKALYLDTAYEIYSQKVHFFYAFVTAITILIILIMPSIEINGQDILEPGILDAGMINTMSAKAFGAYFWFMMIFMIFSSVWLIPSFLKKGRIELTLSKPIGRIPLMMGKFLSVYSIQIAVFVVMSILTWLVFSLRIGNFQIAFFYGLLFGFVEFFCVFSLLAFLGILTRSGIMALIIYYLFRVLTGILSAAHGEIGSGLLKQGALKKFVNIAYNILPKMGDMTDNYTTLMTGQGMGYGYEAWSSALFCVGAMVVMLWLFIRRDY